MDDGAGRTSRGGAHGAVVVGVTPSQPPVVLETATGLAADLGVELVCVHVTTATRPVVGPGGETYWVPAEPEEDSDGGTTAEVEAKVAQVAGPRGVPWRTVSTTGSPAHVIAEVADEAGARLVVVGTRRRGWRGALGDFFTGSVAVQLTHHQRRPVVVVPSAGTSFDEPAPWE